MRVSGLDRQPREEMAAANVITIVDRLDEAEIDVWLDGGWAVDAALGAQRRAHDDLDLIVRVDDVARLEDVLGQLGFELASGEAPKSFELVDELGRQVDVHPVVFAPSGDGVYVMENDELWTYPAPGFAGQGRIIDRFVRCLTPEVQVLCHTGYEPHRQSFDDVWALSEKFDLTVPDEYRAPRETYAVRN